MTELTTNPVQKCESDAIGEDLPIWTRENPQPNPRDPTAAPSEMYKKWLNVRSLEERIKKLEAKAVEWRADKVDLENLVAVADAARISAESLAKQAESEAAKWRKHKAALEARGRLDGLDKADEASENTRAFSLQIEAAGSSWSQALAIEPRKRRRAAGSIGDGIDGGSSRLS